MGVARVVLGDDEQIARLGTYLFDSSHRSLHGQRQHFIGQIVPATWKQVGIHRRQLETRITNVHRAVERRRVLHPFQAEPTLNGRHGVENALLKFVNGAGQSRDEMWNHKYPQETVVGAIVEIEA